MVADNCLVTGEKKSGQKMVKCSKYFQTKQYFFAIGI